MHAHDVAHEPQPEPAAGGVVPLGRRPAIEGLEDTLALLAWDAGAAVLDAQHDGTTVGADGRAHREPTPRGGELRRVRHQVGEHAPEPGRIAAQLRQVCGDVLLDCMPACSRTSR